MANNNQFFIKTDKKNLCCLACCRQCFINNGTTGACGVRKNENGKLRPLVENLVAACCPDRIEKKPVYHFLPNTSALSIGTFGCNFSCAFCQNWHISQTIKLQNNKEVFIEENSRFATPKEIVKIAKSLNCSTIAYTYNEPTVFVEYALKTMKLTKKAGLKNVWVSNGFMSDRTRQAIAPYLDAINIDLKSFNPDFYQKICKARLEPVLENIAWFWKNKVWVETTTLVIPSLNDSTEELNNIAKFLKKISADIPWHLSAFMPNYQMKNIPPTPLQTLLTAYEIGKERGLNFVYLGNVFAHYQFFSTYCPFCNTLLIKRNNHLEAEITDNFSKGKCQNCGKKIAGVWK